MNYKMLDIFSIRTPSLPLQYYFEINDLGKENLSDYIKNKEISDFTKALLMFSSTEMYNNYNQSSITDNYDYQSTLKKYLIRSSTRPTPFGLCSGISLGKFGENTNIIKDDKKSKHDIFVENLWLIKIIKELEKNKKILKKLNFKFNPNAYEIGNRMKSLKMINIIGDSNSNVISSYDIKSNDLIKFVKKIANNYVSFRYIFDNIKIQYGDVEDKIIEDVIFELVENEFIISNLFPNVYNIDLLNHLIIQLDKIDEKEICTSLKKINLKLEKYKNTGDCTELEDATKIMESILKQKNYFYANKYDTFSEYTLEENVKNDLEKFINSFKKLYVDKDDKFNMIEFKKFFSECYGHNVLVKLTDIIDNDKFGEFSSYSVNNQLSERESSIKNIIDIKINESIINNKEEVDLYEHDFHEIIKNQEDNGYSDSIDVNFSIARKENRYEYCIAPNIGADRAGCMINRFAKGCSQSLYKEYIGEIIENDKSFENLKKTNLIDVKDLMSYSRAMNISCNEKINNHCISFYYSANKDEEVTLNDLYLTINHDNNLEVIDIKHNKKCYIVTNDMLNTVANNKVIAFLREITEIQLRSPLYRIQNLTSNSYIYIPRIRYENVIIQPKKWIFSSEMFKLKNFDQFKMKFMKLRLAYNIDDFVYLTMGDNRLLIDINAEDSLKTIFKYINKNEKIVFNELDHKDIDSCIVTNKFNEKFISEMSFSFILEDKDEDNKALIKDNQYSRHVLENEEREKLPFEDNWIYYKIYNVEKNKDKLIKYLENLSIDLLDINKFFFIRYYDDLGYHFRLRIRFSNLNNLNKNIITINKYFKNMRNEGVCRNIIIDTYQREINRYGGKELIDDVEELFTLDTKLVFSIANIFDIDSEDNLDEAYFIGIISLMKVFYDSDIDILKSLDDNTEYKKYRKEYMNNKMKYMELAEDLLNINSNCINTYSNSLLECINERAGCLKKIKYKINNTDLTNNKDNIIYSLNHMYCNRLNGSNDIEDKMLVIIRHAIRDLVNKKRFYTARNE